jgi:hypothetical protein
MENLIKYRQLSVAIMTAMVVALLFSMAALWNSLLTTEAKHEGWVIAFLLILFIAGIGLFLIAFKTSDASRSEKEKKAAYESGKAEIIREYESKNKEGIEQKKADEDVERVVELIMGGIKGARSETSLGNRILAALARQFEFVQGILFLRDGDGTYTPKGEFALTGLVPQPFRKGENLNGQVAESRSIMIVYDIPEDYFKISSGLGQSKPRFLMVVPVMAGDDCIGVMELAAFRKPDESTVNILYKVSDELGKSLSKFTVA